MCPPDSPRSTSTQLPSFSLCISFLFFFCLFRAAPAAYGRSQARGQSRATAAGLHHSHSNTKPKPHRDLHHSSQQHRILNPGSEATSSCTPMRFFTCWATRGTPVPAFHSPLYVSTDHGNFKQLMRAHELPRCTFLVQNTLRGWSCPMNMTSAPAWGPSDHMQSDNSLSF